MTHSASDPTERDADGPTTVWAVLKEDTYETHFGDGYYAYLYRVFATEEEARTFVAATLPEYMNRWHIRRYLLAGNEISPGPRAAEPTTADDVRKLMIAAGPN